MTYKDPNSPYWYIDYVDARGRRQRKSSKSTLKSVAEKMEAEHVVRAERVRQGLEVHDRNPDKLTVAKATQWWIDNIAKHQRGGAKATQVMTKHLIGGGDHPPSTIADIPLEQLTHGNITAFMRAKLNGGLSASSVNHLRAYLSGVFTRLIDEDIFAGVNPVRRTKPMETEAIEPRTNPAHYVPALLAHAPNLSWKVAIAVAANTGMRRGEIMDVFGKEGWPDVNFETRIIWIKKAKKKNVRRVAMTTELVALLEDAKKRHVAMPTECAWSNSSTIVKNALERAGIDDEHATFHGLRGTWATQLMSAPGISRDVVKYMGWGPDRSSVMSVHYVDFPDDVLRREIDRLQWPAPAKVIELKKAGAA